MRITVEIISAAHLKDGGAGGGQTGHGFEEGIYETRDHTAEYERQGTYESNYHPTERDYGKGFRIIEIIRHPQSLKQKTDGDGEEYQK